MLRFEEIAQKSYQAEMSKIAGIKTEVAGTLLHPLGAIATPLAGLAAMLTKTKTPASMFKQNARTASNILLPGTAPYRLFKRMGADNMSNARAVRISLPKVEYR